MVRKFCSRSQGQPRAGSRRPAMMARRRSMPRPSGSGMAMLTPVRFGARVLVGECRTEAIFPRPGGRVKGCFQSLLGLLVRSSLPVLAEQDAANDPARPIGVLADLRDHFLLAGRMLLDPGHVRQNLAPGCENILLVGEPRRRFRHRTRS